MRAGPFSLISTRNLGVTVDQLLFVGIGFAGQPLQEILGHKTKGPSYYTMPR